MKIQPNPMTDTVTIKPRRVYKCVQEGRRMLRKDVSKDHHGKFHCGSCGGIVEDVTNTDTGRYLLEILAV